MQYSSSADNTIPYFTLISLPTLVMFRHEHLHGLISLESAVTHTTNLLAIVSYAVHACYVLASSGFIPILTLAVAFFQ